uniref:NADH dehydrogenase subunit 6 n=1 Tax=Margaritifera margaritifera TaxID=102329 RepID=S4S2A1_PINMG|nr:NADH dehydrogenase subunit 6 [Pinctada margaritifera]
MLSLFCFILVGVISWVMMNHKSPIVVFISIILLSGILGIWGWLLGEDLKGLCLFLLVSGSLMTVFGFLLCLIPWEIGRKGKGSGCSCFSSKAYCSGCFWEWLPWKSQGWGLCFFWRGASVSDLCFNSGSFIFSYGFGCKICPT